MYFAFETVVDYAVRFCLLLSDHRRVSVEEIDVGLERAYHAVEHVGIGALGHEQWGI